MKMKDTRLSLNLTQAELAEKFGVSSTTIARWERGEVVPEATGMLELALEALQTRAVLGSDEYAARRQKVKQSVQNTLNDARKRVKHPQTAVV